MPNHTIIIKGFITLNILINKIDMIKNSKKKNMIFFNDLCHRPPLGLLGWMKFSQLKKKKDHLN